MHDIAKKTKQNSIEEDLLQSQIFTRIVNDVVLTKPTTKWTVYHQCNNNIVKGFKRSMSCIYRN